MHTDFWENIRKDFKICKKLAYFHSAGLSPIPQAVYKAIRKSYKRLYEVGDLDWHNDLDESMKLLGSLGDHLNTSAENLALLPNTSMAMSMVALSLKRHINSPFNIVSTEDEFPATNIPFEYQDIPVKYVQPANGRYSIDAMMSLVDESTKAIVCSYVQYSSGFRQDIESLGKAANKKGLLFIVNATQGFPFFPIDVEKMHIDVMAASLHKWGCAGHVGSLFYTSESYRKAFPSPLAGWLSVKPPEDEYIITAKGQKVNIHPTAMQYQYGTSNLQSVLGLKAAWTYMSGIGFENIRQRVLELVTQTIAHLNQIQEVEIHTPHSHAGEQSAIISFDLRQRNNQACVEYLAKKGVIAAIRNDNIRVSCNYFTNLDDINRLTQGIREFLNKP